MKTPSLKHLSIITVLFVLGGAGCGDDSEIESASTREPLPDSPRATATPAPPGAAAADNGFVQIERLARPALNEGLVVTNDSLNTFNSLPPSEDLGEAAAPARAEASRTLSAVTRLASGGPSAAEVTARFLPDVMRIKIDEANSRPGDPEAAGIAAVGYTSCLNTSGSGPFFCGGRKLRDDVMDITLSYIASGDPLMPYGISDRVGYSSTHQAPLTVFPFLAPPH